jgi:hypothetical protein
VFPNDKMAGTVRDNEATAIAVARAEIAETELGTENEQSPLTSSASLPRGYRRPCSTGEQLSPACSRSLAI